MHGMPYRAALQLPGGERRYGEADGGGRNQPRINRRRDNPSRDWAGPERNRRNASAPYTILLCQIEQKNFSLFICLDRHRFLFAYRRTVSLIQLLAVQFDFALSDLEPRVTLGAK